LDDENPTVRLWAAAHTLDLDTPKTLRVLRALEKGMGYTAVHAELLLVRWAQGDVEFPS